MDDGIPSARDRILEAARDLFLTKGYNGSNLRDIAGRARVSMGGIYHHFDSKESMVDEILSTFQEELFAAYDAVLAGDVDARTRDEIGEFGAGGVATAEVEGLNHGSTMLVASSDDAVGSQQSLELTVEIRRDRDRVRDLEHARVVAAHQSQPHLVVARVPDQHVIEL